MRRFWLNWSWIAMVCVAGCGDDGQGPGDAGMDAGDKPSEAGVDGGRGGPSGMDAGMDAGGSIPDAGADVPLDGAMPDGTISDGGVDGACPEGATGTPPEDYVALFRSGSRLRARTFAADGMPDVFAGFYDTQLGVPCDFLRASDGAWRCLPRRAALRATEGFVDAECSQALVRTSPSCVSQKGYRRERTECSEVYEARELRPLTETTSHYASGDCDARGNIDAADDLFFTSEPLDPTMFVQGMIVELPGACEASVRVVEGVDGSRAAFELFDVATGLGCRSRAGRCAPSDVLVGDPTLYADDTCSERAIFGVSSDPSGCRTPALINPSMEDGYRWVDGVYEGEVYSNVGGCIPAREQDWITTVYAPGERLAAESLAFFDGAMEGSGRLQARVLSEAGERLMSTASGEEPRLYDTRRDGSCVPLLFEDGVWRCVMSDWSRAGIEPHAYEDAACERPLHHCTGDSCAEAVFVDQAIDSASCATQAPVSGIWVLREPAVGNSYYRQDGVGACYEVSEAIPEDRWLADAFDASQLATVQLRSVD